MLRCNNCGYEFEIAIDFIDKHGFDSPPYEMWRLCPACKSEFIEESYTYQLEDES